MRRFSKLLLFSFFFCKDGSDRLMKRASFSCCNFLCVVLAAAYAYLKYRWCHLSCLPFVWHFFHCDTHARTHRERERERETMQAGVCVLAWQSKDLSLTFAAVFVPYLFKKHHEAYLHDETFVRPVSAVFELVTEKRHAILNLQHEHPKPALKRQPICGTFLPATHNHY